MLRREGFLGKEVADRLGITLNTLQSHTRRAFSKLGVRNTLAAVRFL
jgi:DNA-binding NarL/FixJ family response regulator